MQNLKKLISLATAVREACEIYAMQTGRYNPNLCGLCYDASSIILKLAEEHGIKGVQLGGSGYHWFVLFNNTIIDVTATQFGTSEKIAIRNVYETTEDWWKIYDREDFSKSHWRGSEAYSIKKIAEELLNRENKNEQREIAC